MQIGIFEEEDEFSKIGLSDLVPVRELSEDELQKYKNEKGHSVLVLLEEIEVASRLNNLI